MAKSKTATLKSASSRKMTASESVQRVVVTGGSGFIGTHVMRKLGGQHIEAITLSRSGERPGLVRADIRDRDAVEAILKPGDAVIHLANSTNPTTSESDRVRDVEENLVGTLQLLEACVKKGIVKFVFASSGGTVYGIPNAIPIPETHETNPISAHGAMKLAAEKYVQVYSAKYGFDYVLLRCANAYGPGQTGLQGQGIIGRAILAALANEPLEIWGDGSAVRDFVFVEDVAEALIRAAQSSLSTETINIGMGNGTSLNEVVELVRRITGELLTVRYGPPRRFDVPASVLDIRKAETLLGWEPATGLEEGVERCYAWARSSFGQAAMAFSPRLDGAEGGPEEPDRT